MKIEEHNKFACERLYMFLQFEIDKGRPLTEKERAWFEAEKKGRIRK